MKTSDFDYILPQDLIAQTPIEPRDHSRLLLLSRETGEMDHRRFYELNDLLKPGDILVCNDSRVLAARLFVRKGDTGGKAEILLIRHLNNNTWEVLAKPGRRLYPGVKFEIVEGRGTQGRVDRTHKVTGEVLDRTESGGRIVRFSDGSSLEEHGVVPLPPYIHTPLNDPERYQTVYARSKGSAAAPTAGLHFTDQLINTLQNRGIEFVFGSLHVGLDTFRPVSEEDPRDHKMHSEYCVLAPEAADYLNKAKAEGRRVIAVGTTSVRILETAAFRGGDGQSNAACQAGIFAPFSGWTDIFITPGHEFRGVDALITNFHFPRSTLLMLVSAFAGKNLIDRAYQEAVSERYRFFSFGDAMLIS